MKIFVLVFQALFGKLPFCALVGAAVGSLAGLQFCTVQLAFPSLHLAWQEIIAAGALLSVVGVMGVLLVLGMWLKYGVQQLLVPTVINGLLSSMGTVAVAIQLNIPAVDGPLGLFVGILVGGLLCQLCRHVGRRE